MNSEQWQKVKELFQVAIERDPEDRASLISEFCGDDSELKEEVERLIANHDEAGDFIEEPAVAIGASSFDSPIAEPLVGRRVGAYRLVREIGVGGMGAVYLAVRDDEQFQKRVAIKLVRQGLDTQSIVRRFRNERQILASLDHPNIAKLLDGGTTPEGVPYFVMDYIEGLPIDSYCNRQGLSISERLKLFRTVCSAVHYAHQSLVVHRDLKPGNILINSDGVPKLLDFGIAKLLNPELTAVGLEQTQTIFGPMTPAYASPEQVLGEPITTASDTYSLGVILFELLTGKPPYSFNSRDPKSIAEVVCEQEPPRPSTAVKQVSTVEQAHGPTQSGGGPQTTSMSSRISGQKLHRKLSGDLDNIVLMALRKEPGRRYASVQQFSEDLARHLDGRTVMARPDTFAYRTSKFVTRNKAGVAAAVLIIVSLITGLGLALWQARVARTEKERAERRFNDVRKLANSLLFELDDKIQKEPTEARSLLVKMGLEYIDRLAHEAAGDSSLQRELANAYEKLGDILGNPYSPNLGDTPGAIASYKKALTIREQLFAANPASVDMRRDLARSYSQTARMMWTVNDTSGVIELVRKGLAIYDALLKEQTSDDIRRERAQALNLLAEGLVWSGDIPSAREASNESLATLQSLAATRPGDLALQRDLAQAYDKQAVILHAEGNTQSALDAYAKQLVVAERAFNDTGNDEARRYFAFSLMKVGDILYVMGDQKQSIALYREALEYFRRSLNTYQVLAERDSKNVRAQRDISVSYNKLGDALWMTGDKRGALDSYRKALAIRETLVAGQQYAFHKNDLAVSYTRVGEALATLGDVEGGINNHKKAVAIYEALSNSDPSNVVTRRDVGVASAGLASAYLLAAQSRSTDEGRNIENLRQARYWYQRALDVFEDLRQRGWLRNLDADQPANIRGNIAKLDAMLESIDSEKTSTLTTR